MIIDQILYKNKKERHVNAFEKNGERPIRSIVKTLSWRTVGTLDTILISWLLIGDVALAFSIGSIELFTKMVLYFVHERVWNKIKWGK
jgi:uncharacterized membrane protein